MFAVSTLPACARLSLWVTAAWAGHLDLDDAVRRAMPDVDEVHGALDRLALWQDFGERVLGCALPRPGDLTGMPRGSLNFTGAAADSGECVYVPALGGALVPTIETYGPEGDTGTQITWTAYDCEPTPVHQLESLQESQIERDLAELVREATAAFETLDVQPWAGSTARAEVDSRVRDHDWGLPPGLPGRAHRILVLAGSIASAVDVALAESPAVHGHDDGARHALLLRLQAGADRALAQATTSCALSLGGLRPAR